MEKAKAVRSTTTRRADLSSGNMWKDAFADLLQIQHLGRTRYDSSIRSFMSCTDHLDPRFQTYNVLYQYNSHNINIIQHISTFKSSDSSTDSSDCIKKNLIFSHEKNLPVLLSMAQASSDGTALQFLLQSLVGHNLGWCRMQLLAPMVS